MLRLVAVTEKTPQAYIANQTFVVSELMLVSVSHGSSTWGNLQCRYEWLYAGLVDIFPAHIDNHSSRCLIWAENLAKALRSHAVGLL